MVLAVEIIVCCLIFGIYRVIRIKRDPAYKISNMSDTYILDDSACHTDIDSRGNKLFNGLCVCAFDMDGSSIVS